MSNLNEMYDAMFDKAEFSGSKYLIVFSVDSSVILLIGKNVQLWG